MVMPSLAFVRSFSNSYSGSVKHTGSLTGMAKAAHYFTQLTGISIRRSYQLELKPLTSWEEDPGLLSGCGDTQTACILTGAELQEMGAAHPRLIPECISTVVTEKIKYQCLPDI